MTCFIELDKNNFVIRISEISSDYGIAKLIITVLVKVNKEIKISEEGLITLKELAKLKKKMKYYS
ncbi:hypothetical protein [Clostridium perfringens]|uniref:hypothetical protein n=1 Tax=Clostridium perfringens TaxID=1502 RepID=UPI001A2461B2|nr:hypothetical protein [Clostridium perfringens]MDZ4906165.1 hypothetical protein [Clostridium perfringens]HAT4224185.1 hypothetical protein [Clostridium perfringens]